MFVYKKLINLFRTQHNINFPIHKEFSTSDHYKITLNCIAPIKIDSLKEQYNLILGKRVNRFLTSTDFQVKSH